jgi:hypothetical protein
MSHFDVLEKKVHVLIHTVDRLKKEKQELSHENRRLISELELLRDENSEARKLIAHNSILTAKQKKIRERVERLWEQVSQAV